MAPPVLPQSARRLRDEPIDTATTIVEQFGLRSPTSLGEAQAAAYFDARLRRAGLKVSADAVDAPAWSGWDGTVLGCWVLVAVLLYRWLPQLSIVMVLIGLAFAVYALFRIRPVFNFRQQASQNIIGTRALAQKPQKRVVLLANIDAPPHMPRLVQILHDGDRPRIGRVMACALVLVLALGGVAFADYGLRVACWYGQFLPAAYLLFAAGIDVWLWRSPASPGAVNYAGALGVLLACAEELTVAQQIELWVVALGASHLGSGLEDLLRRYPFEPARTRFIALEALGSGSLAYFTRSGLVRQTPSDADLLALAAAADADDPLINAEPRPLHHSPTTAGTLLRRGWKAISIGCVDAEGRAPYRGSAEDTAHVLNADVLERAVRLVVSLVRKIDAEQV